MWAASSRAQSVFNGQWNFPENGDTGTSMTAQLGATNTPGATTGWYLSPAPNPDFGYTNNGQRDQFYSNEPIVNPGPPATGWSLWLQNFTQSGFASETVKSVTAGTTYNFSSLFSFQDGTGPGMGYNAVTLANQTEASPVAPNTGDMYSYLAVQYQNSSGAVVGPTLLDGNSAETDIPAGSVTNYVIPSGTGAGSTAWAPYSVIGTAPAGATQVSLLIGWNNGGLDGGTGGQSAFADDATLTAVVPEPASISLLGLGGMALMARRRRARTA
jgi:hypothetical protein